MRVHTWTLIEHAAPLRMMLASQLLSVSRKEEEEKKRGTCQQVKARTSSPLPRATSLAVASLGNVSIRELARNVRTRSRGYVLATVVQAVVEIRWKKKSWNRENLVAKPTTSSTCAKKPSLIHL